MEGESGGQGEIVCFGGGYVCVGLKTGMEGGGGGAVGADMMMI